MFPPLLRWKDGATERSVTVLNASQHEAVSMLLTEKTFKSLLPTASVRYRVNDNFKERNVYLCPNKPGKN